MRLESNGKLIQLLQLDPFARCASVARNLILGFETGLIAILGPYPTSILFVLCPDLSNALPLQDAWSPRHWAAKKRLCSEFRWTAAAGHCFSQSHSALQGILQAESYVENPALHDSQQTFLPLVNYFLSKSLWASFVPRRHFCRASRWLRQAMTTRNRPCGRSFNRLRCSK